MKTLFSLFLLFFCTTIAATTTTTTMEGSYYLTQVVDANVQQIELPSDTYSFKITTATTTTDNDHASYQFGMHIGNSLGCTVTLNNDDVVQKVSGIRSTMMMPPENVYKVENAVKDILSTLQTIQYFDDTVTLNGDGTITARKVQM